MKTKILCTLLFVALFAQLPAAGHHSEEHHEGEGALSEDERAQLVELLERSRSQLEALTARVDGDLWAEKPADDRWSVGEVVEHLVLAESGIVGMAHQALGAPEDPEWRAISEALSIDGLIENLADRSQKFQAPEMLQPTGEKGRTELLAEFAKARAATLEFVRSTDAPVKRHTAEGPPGKMTAHQWLGLVGAHTLRHNQQIEEVLAQLAER